MTHPLNLMSVHKDKVVFDSVRPQADINYCHTLPVAESSQCGRIPLGVIVIP